MDELADLTWGDTSTTKAAYTADGFPAFSASGPDGCLPYYDYERDGVVLSAIGANCGRVYFARNKWSCIKNTIRFWGRDGIADTRFLYYATSDPTVWVKRGSAQPFITQGDARALRMRVPVDLGEQRRIAAVLGALDDKIASNQKLDSLLERAMLAVFRALFVDFIGVEEFKESEIGLIPRDWRVVSFADVVAINPKVSIKRGESVPFIDMAGVDPWATRPTRIRRRAYAGGSRFEFGDTLMARITGCIEHGKGAFVDFIDTPGAGSTEFLVLRARPPLTAEAAFILSRTGRVRDHAIASMTGSSGRQRVVAAALADLKLAVPPDARSWADEAVFMRAAMRQTNIIWRESRTLSYIRDALLPKLISGEIRVPDTTDPEEVIGPAAEGLVEAKS